METQQALEILGNALNAATLKGVFNLQDTRNILSALDVLHLAIQPKTQAPKEEALRPE